MKRFFVMLPMFLSFLTSAQSPDGSRIWLFEEIIDSLPFNQAQLVEKPIEWAGETFPNAKETITSSTENQIKMRFGIADTDNPMVDVIVYYDMLFEFKDEKVCIKM